MRHRRPHPGSISTDRVAIAGSRGFLDLHAGDRPYYHGYFLTNRDVSAIANRLGQIRTEINLAGRLFLFVCIPNKATCLPENYPLWLPCCPTPRFAELENLLELYDGMMFGRWMREGDFAARSALWLETDSRWSSLGAWAAADRLLQGIGSVLPEPTHTTHEPAWGGDLSARWHGLQCREIRSRSFDWKEDPRVAMGPSEHGGPGGPLAGSMVHWRNPRAAEQKTVLIVGDSFSAAGDAPEHLTYWFSALFRDVLFLHASAMPHGIVERCPADIYVLQTDEASLAAEEMAAESPESAAGECRPRGRGA